MQYNNPTTPSFRYGYWRPWKENADVSDSFLDYLKETSLEKYGADIIGKYISVASKEQIQAIGQLGVAIGRGLNVLSDQFTEIDSSLRFLNRKVDMQIEQQQLGNLLLQNISELLRVPDSEKERQRSIELGIKFFVNAQKDEDLFSDALEEFLKAESLMKQDYFVLHRIGCIYLYVKKHFDPNKALDYFVKAAKYAIVESDANAIRLVNILTGNVNSINNPINESEKKIGQLAADSYEKAAFASYVLGQFDDAVNYQKKVIKIKEYPNALFYLAKYLFRSGNVADGVSYLDSAINKNLNLLEASFKDIDIINEPLVLKLIEEKNNSINVDILNLRSEWENIDSDKAIDTLKSLDDLLGKSYKQKVFGHTKYLLDLKNTDSAIAKLNSNIEELIKKINSSIFCSFDKAKLDNIINELIDAKSKSYQTKEEIYNKFVVEIENDRLKLGSKYGGGIVFYLDESGKHGLVYADKDLGEADWGANGIVGTKDSFGSGRDNTKKILKLASWTEKWDFFNKTKVPFPTAARICSELNHNGHKDWFLPSFKELEILFKNTHLETGGYPIYKFLPIFTGIKAKTYWSSTEDTRVIRETEGPTSAFVFHFAGQYADSYSRTGTFSKTAFIAVREF